MLKTFRAPVTCLFTGLLFTAVLMAQAPGDWPNYGRDAGGTKYSPLNQITPANVNKLAVVWTYHTTDPGGTWEETPLVINHVMYFASQKNRTIALDADTGKELWQYDPKTPRVSEHRGVSYWPGDSSTPARIVLGTADRLIELDAKTGQPVAGFGDNGVINLRTGVADDYPRAHYAITSPPVIYKGLIILGPSTQESPTKGPSGDPRAFDAKTGKLVWRFHTVPQPGEPGNDTWGPEGWKDRSGPSAWGGMTLDAAKGLVFLPVGNPADSFYGADRPGTNLYANSVVALDAATGKLKWAYQIVHHDIFDADVAAPPSLVEATVNGKRVPAVAEFSKVGMLFVLDETTGKPVWGMEERPVPQSDVPGEHSWPTQPFTVKPPPLARLSVTKDELSNISPESHDYCVAQFEKYKSLGPFTPMALEPRLSFPSSIGGGNWAGVAFDPKQSYVFVNWSNLGQTGQIDKAPANAPMAYRNRGAYGRFVDKEGYPCSAPPWGELAAVDTKTGNVAWKVPLGSFDELEARGIKNTGSLSLGGPIATAGGLVFIGATADGKFRAFDSKTGKELWTVKLPASGNATPISYTGQNGKQFIVIVAGGQGHLPGKAPAGDSVIAYALP
ncbi:MAG TPA: pyrroloquinoline quinone-dependent dehydrogenase [Bryobacteraceae bacterium]|nr:pyrroloquinoline quinone-dependent dehydrogenase [Bryobacteraceae bacterium]